MPVALLSRSSLLTSVRSAGLTGGQLAIASTCEVRGSTTIAVARLEAGQPLVFGADGADYLARHLALRVGAAAVGQLADPFDVERFDLRRGAEVGFFRQVGETPFGGQRFQHVGLGLIEDRSQARRRGRRVFDLVGGGEDRRRVFGGGELVAAAVEEGTAQPGTGDDFGLLGGRLRGEARARHPLPPEGPADDEEETEEEAAEEKPDPTLD